MTDVFTIPSEKLPKLHAMFAKFAKKARKFGVAAPSIEIGPIMYCEVRTVRDDGTVSIGVPMTEEEKSALPERNSHGIIIGRRFLPFHQVTLHGVAPKLAGWTFIGRIDHTGPAPIMCAVPGHTMPAWARSSTAFCQHCNSQRRRNNTYVLVHEDNREIEVGGNCLADFLGVSAEAAIASLSYIAKARDEMDGEGGFGLYTNFRAAALEVLAVTSAVIREFGWASKGTASETGVTRVVRRDNSRLEVDATDMQIAEKTLAWVRGELADKVAKGNGGDYEYNLSAILADDMVEANRIGFAASAVVAYQRAEGYKIENAKRNAGQTASKHFGKLNEREKFSATVIMALQKEGNYGTMTIVKFLTTAGDVAVWFASGSQQIKVGDKVNVTGTVSKHDEYQGVKSTTLKRCVVVAEEKAVA